ASLVVSDTADHVINNAEKTSIAQTIAGHDADVTTGGSATVTFTSSGGGTKTVAASNATTTVDLSSLPDGAITTSLSITDAAGNTKIVSGNSFTLDTTADAGTAASLVVSDTADHAINNAEKTS